MGGSIARVGNCSTTTKLHQRVRLELGKIASASSVNQAHLLQKFLAKANERDGGAAVMSVQR